MKWDLNEAIAYYRKQGAPADQSAVISLLREVQENTDGSIPAELLPEWDPQKRESRQVLIESCYDGYLQREEKEIRRRENLEVLAIPADFDYNTLPGLCNEARQKLLKLRPVTLGQASRIDGVTPIDVALIQVALKKGSSK